MNKVCEVCGKLFFKSNKLSRNQWSSRRFCSRTCGATKRNVNEDASIVEMYRDGF